MDTLLTAGVPAVKIIIGTSGYRWLTDFCVNVVGLLGHSACSAIRIKRHHIRQWSPVRVHGDFRVGVPYRFFCDLVATSTCSEPAAKTVVFAFSFRQRANGRANSSRHHFCRAFASIRIKANCIRICGPMSIEFEIGVVLLNIISCYFATFSTGSGEIPACKGIIRSRSHRERSEFCSYPCAHRCGFTYSILSVCVEGDSIRHACPMGIDGGVFSKFGQRRYCRAPVRSCIPAIKSPVRPGGCWQCSNSIPTVRCSFRFAASATGRIESNCDRLANRNRYGILFAI